jgi:hypothetical protein
MSNPASKSLWDLKDRAAHLEKNADLSKQLLKATREIASLKKLLKSIEWVEENDGRGGSWSFCPKCGNIGAHTHGCKLELAIREDDDEQG